MKRQQITMRQNRFSTYKALLLSAVVGLVLILSYFTASGLESHLGYSRNNPPPSGYWYSDIPGSYNPWTDDIQKTLLEFPAINKGFPKKEDIQILPAGWLPGDKWSKDTYVDGEWEFVDLGILNDSLKGNNWVHGNGFRYPKNTWVQQFSGAGTFSYVRSMDARFLGLEGYRGIAIEVSNLGDTYIVFSSKMNSWWDQKDMTARIGLEPGETDIIYHPFLRDETHVAPEIHDYFGVTDSRTGFPGGFLNGSRATNFEDGAGIWIITAMVPPGVEEGDVKWTLNRMWAGGRFQVPSIAEISNPNYEPWTDQYGQWRHDDWVGKIWNQQDLIDQYAEIAQYIEDNPGPSEWNKWGGWEAGPQLEATGYFRTVKYPPPPPEGSEEEDNSRWWFVDPDGRLFLSQGVMSVWPTGGSYSGEAGYTEEAYFDEIYFPRLRSIGINTAGGRSREKRLLGIMPYVYQTFSGYGSITEDDILGEGEAAFRQHIRDVIFKAEAYARDPYCIGFLIDNELKLYGGDTLSKDQVEEIYFGAVREALDALAEKINTDPDSDIYRPPILMFDPASNGGYWMAYYVDVITMHRMEGYNPATHKDEFDSLGTWGIDKPLGQFSFNMGNLDAGLSSYGVTMFLNQRNRAQGVSSYMRQAYDHPNNIAVHFYKYKKGPHGPLSSSHHIISMTDALDYWFADYVGGIGNDIYRIHMGEVGECSLGECGNNDAPDYSMSASLHPLVIDAGGTVELVVRINPNFNFTGTVTISVTSPSPDLLVSPAEIIVDAPYDPVAFTLTDTHDLSFTEGVVYNIPITASGGGVEHTAQVNLFVNGTQMHLPVIGK